MDSQASSTLIGQVFSHLSAHGLLPGLAAHFCFLLRCGVKDMAHALSLLGGSCLVAKHMLLHHHSAIQPTQQLLYLEVYNLNLATWFTFQTVSILSREILFLFYHLKKLHHSLNPKPNNYSKM